MSENILKLIPDVRSFVPTSCAESATVALLRGFIRQASRVDSTRSDRVRFVDAGTNLGRIRCPACGSELDAGWWRGEMDRASATDFSDLALAIPCCGSQTSLDTLLYEWPVGFSRFVLEVEGADRDLTDAELAALQQALGCGLRRIWAHY